MQIITEKMNIHDKWYAEADTMTMENLPEFLRKLTEDYHHDYGTICHALSAGALATVHAMDNSPCGGITGFQAGCIMWSIIQKMNYRNNKCGLRIQDMDELLYPQRENLFNCIRKDTWKFVQDEAKKRIQENEQLHKNYLREIELYESDLEQFKRDVRQFELEHPEYPKYEENPRFYEHLGGGTMEEWEMEHKKEESGFMFAPRKPWDASASARVVEHWKSIVAGNVPFGLRLED